MLGRGDNGNSKVSWELTVRNLSQSRVRMDAIVRFVNSSSEPVLEHTEPGLVLDADREQKFNGIKELSPDVLSKVSGLKAALVPSGQGA